MVESPLLDRTCNELKQFVIRAIRGGSLEVSQLQNGDILLTPRELHLVEEALARIPAPGLDLLARASGLVPKDAALRSDALSKLELHFGPVALTAWELVVTRSVHDILMNEISRADNPTYSLSEHEFAVQESWRRCLAVRERVDAYRQAHNAP